MYMIYKNHVNLLIFDLSYFFNWIGKSNLWDTSDLWDLGMNYWTAFLQKQQIMVAMVFWVMLDLIDFVGYFYFFKTYVQMVISGNLHFSAW